MILVLGKSALSVPDTRFSRVSGSTLGVDISYSGPDENVVEDVSPGSPSSGLAYLFLTCAFLYPYPQAGEGHELQH